MCSYGYTPIEWFSSGRRPRSSYYPPPMSQPVSKSFNRISDFIFPDTVHIRSPSLQQQYPPLPYGQHYRTQNYSLPVLNRHSFPQRDVIIVERLPAEDVDLLYREQHHQPKRPIRRRYSSIVDERRAPTYERTSAALANRSAAYRDRIRDRRKRHTTENAYHSMLKSMLEEDEQQHCTNERDSNYLLSYRTTLDPITDSESMTSIHQPKRQQPQQQHPNHQSYGRVPINGTIPIFTERERSKQRHDSSSMSSRNSSSDTDTMGRRPVNIEHQHESSYIHSSKISPPVWECLQHQPDRFIPINPLRTDTNNHETMSYTSNHRISSSPFDNVINHQINNQPSASHDSTHQVSLCVNNLHTSLFIDEDALNQAKATNNTGGKAVIKTFIDRIIKRLQHFKHSLDHGLIHVHKPNNLVNGTIVTENSHSHAESIREKRSNDLANDQKVVRPYFLIQPQTVLLLPNETAKFKCCFGGDPFPSLVWSHNESRVPFLSKYRMHKLHDIHYLDIGPIDLRDSGQIKCTIINRFGQEETTAQLLVVPSAADGTPCITQILNDVTIIEGQPLKLSCGIYGLQVTVNWFHNGKLISPPAQSKSDYNNESAIFTLSSCLRSDAGTVDCLVKNRFGDVRTSCRIEVINDPELDR